MAERLGIFGGTFDPPHIGHLILASEASDQLGLDAVLWVLTPYPPHKKGKIITPMEIRLDMVRAAIKDCPDFKLSKVDIERPAPHYAIETVKRLSEKFPKADLIYLMGGDSLRDLTQWFAYNEFVEACTEIGVMRRPGDKIDIDQLEFQIQGIQSKIRFIDTPTIEISASQIRIKANTGATYKYYVPPLVYKIIKRLNLYQNKE